MSTKKTAPEPRRPLFQTANSGIGYVHTSMDAHFDPYCEPSPAGVTLSRAAMEAVPKIEVGAA